MKSKKLFFIAFVATFVLSACDELLTTDIDVPIVFTLVEKVAVPEDLDPEAKNEFITGGKYDILSHPDVAEVIGTPDEIKKIKITKIQYGYEKFTGNVDAVISGEIILPTNGGSGYLDSDIGAYYQITPVNIAEAALLSDQFTLTGDFKEVNEYLSQEVEMQYAFMGKTTHNPVVFNIVIQVTATVTVELGTALKGL